MYDIILIELFKLEQVVKLVFITSQSRFLTYSVWSLTLNSIYLVCELLI